MMTSRRTNDETFRPAWRQPGERVLRCFWRASSSAVAAAVGDVIASFEFSILVEKASLAGERSRAGERLRREGIKG
jgi:hypothetical protein